MSLSDKQIDIVVRLLKEIKSNELLPVNIFYEFARLKPSIITEVVPLRKAKTTEVYLLRRPNNDPFWPGMLHTPGTVMRNTDESRQMSLKRIIDKELLLQDKTVEPVFVGEVFHKVARGVEVAAVYYLNLSDNKLISKNWYSANKLPKNVVESQLDFISMAVKKFEQSV